MPAMIRSNFADALGGSFKWYKFANVLGKRPWLESPRMQSAILQTATRLAEIKTTMVYLKFKNVNFAN